MWMSMTSAIKDADAYLSPRSRLLWKILTSLPTSKAMAVLFKILIQMRILSIDQAIWISIQLRWDRGQNCAQQFHYLFPRSLGIRPIPSSKGPEREVAKPIFCPPRKLAFWEFQLSRVKIFLGIKSSTPGGNTQPMIWAPQTKHTCTNFCTVTWAENKSPCLL